MENITLINSYKKTMLPYKKSNTIVIDNGTFEIKGGYMNNEPAIKFKNCFYKESDGLKYESNRNKSSYTPFTFDLITGLHVLEENMDQILEYLKVQKCNNLIITDTIYSPMRDELLKFLFEVYRFNKVQIGIDAIYSYLYNTKEEKDSIIISMGHTSIIVYVYSNKKIEDVYKLNYGGKYALQYITNTIRFKYKIYNQDCSNLLKKLKCPLDYDREVLEIVENMRNMNYEESVCIGNLKEEEYEDDIEDHSLRKRILVDKINKMVKKERRISVEEEYESSEKESTDMESDENISSEKSRNESDEHTEQESEEHTEQESEVNTEQESEEIVDSAMDDKIDTTNNIEDVTNDKEADINNITETQEFNIKLRKSKKADANHGLYGMKLYQVKLKITKKLSFLKDFINRNEEYIEEKYNLPEYLSKKKARYEEIIRELEIREKCRKDAVNRKTYEFNLLLRTGELTEEEKKYKKKIKECENTEIDEKLIKEKDALLKIINKHDRNYILSKSNILDLLSGKHLNKVLVNVDLLKACEIAFEPSLIGSNQMGLGEILENILSKYRNIKDVFITGGFSNIKGIKERIQLECNKYAYNDEISVRNAEDPVNDAFKGAHFSDLFETYTLSEYSKSKKE